MITAIVKGTYYDAELAAGQRGIDVRGTIDWPHANEAVIKIDDSNFPKVVKWFLEEEETPFKIGTLLWYKGPDGKGERF